MKKLLSMICFAIVALALPAGAKDEKKDDKKDAKAKKEKVEIAYTAIISSAAELTEADVGKIKSALNASSEFTCKDVKIDGKEIHATVIINKGRLSKSDLSKALKENKNFKVEKLEEVKEDKKKDEKEEKKKEDK